MTAQNAYDATKAAELRDAAINASASAWRITGLDVSPLIKCGEDYERPVSLEDLACLSGDSLGWSAQSDTARRIADVWNRAAEAWQAAAVHAQGMQASAIAELRRQQAADQDRREPQELNDMRSRPQAEPEDPRRSERPESFRILNGKSYRAARRPSSIDHGEASGN
jgi:hypothetical protein